MIPELAQDFRSRIKISSSAARHFARNSETVPDMLIKSAGEAIFEHSFDRVHKNTF